MNLPGKRLLLGTAIATAALGVGGIAYAAGNDPATPDQGYVTIEDDATTPSPGASTADGYDCPEKNGGQGQAQPETQPETNPQGNA
jgi:hypothetical protein